MLRIEEECQLRSAQSTTAGLSRTGIVIYLKASMTAKEETWVRQYKSSHLAFPHETTGDQF